MRTYVLPLRYFLILFLIIGVMMGIVILADIVASKNLPSLVTIILKSPFTNAIAENTFETLCIAVFILVLYTVGVYCIVRKMPDEASRFTSVKIFSIILLALGLLLGLWAWLQNPGQIVLSIGIIWAALLVALRDLIQNIIGSLVLLVTRVFSIGDRIHIRGVYGIVIDIGVFRTTLMQLDKESGDHPSGQITTIPNGILFREMVTNSSRELSFTSDEIRITFPFSIDIQKTRALLLDIVRKHTREAQEEVAQEIERLGDRKFLPDFKTEPTVFVHIDKYQILMVVKYFTRSYKRSEIKNQIVEEISGIIPGITSVDQ